MKRLLLLLLLFPSIVFAQGGRLSQDPWVSNRQGFPAGGTNIAICQPLATTAATVTANLAVFTMASNPITAGFTAGMTIQVAGFTGGDTFFNAGTLANGFLTGGLAILSVSTTTVIASLNHANASAVTNGTLLQFGNTVTPCAGLSTIYTDASITTTTPNPFQADGLGNYGAGAAAGVYYTQLYGSGITTTLRQIVVASATGGGGGGGGSICITTANSIQYNNAGVAGCAAGITTPDGNILNIKGPVPWIDATQYGMRTFGNPPNTITVTTAASSPTVPTTGISDFIKNDGVVIPRAGNATAQSTPAAPTLAMIGASGAQTVNYKCVAVDRQWGLSIASPATAITNVPTVFGAVATQISTISRSSNVVTVTTTIPMPFSSGTFHARIANITGGTTQFSGLQAVTVTGATTLTYSQTGADESGTAGATSFVRFDNAFFVTTAQATAGSNQVVLTTDIAHNIQWNNSAFNPDEVFVDGIQFTGANPQGYAIGPFPVGGVGGSTITINTSYTSPITVTGVASHNYSTSQSGVDIMTVTNFPKVIVTCPAVAGTTVYYAVYADYGTGYAPIGFTPWLHNKFEDYGPAFTKTGFTPPPAMNLPATPPVAAQNQVFAGQIASIAGSTLTLTGNVPAMVSGVTAYHDDGVAFQNAIAASCSGGNVSHSVYLPPPSSFGYYFFHAPVDLSTTCNRTHIVDGGAIFANGTIYDDNSGYLEWGRPEDLSGWNNTSTGSVNRGQIYIFGYASPQMVTPPVGSAYIAGMEFNVSSNSGVSLFVQNSNVTLNNNTFETVGAANNLSSIPFEFSNGGFEFRMSNTAWSGSVNTQYPVTAAGDPPVGDIAYWPVPVFDFFGPTSVADTIIIDGINYGVTRGFRMSNLYGNSQTPPMVIISDVRTYQSPYNPLWKAVGNAVMPRLSITRAISDSIQQPISSCIRSDNGPCGTFYNDDVNSNDGNANMPVFTGPPYGTALQYVSPGAALAQNTNEFQVGGGTSGFNLYGAGTGTNPILSLFCSGGTGNAFSAFDTTATSRSGITCPGGLLSIGGTTGFTGTATQANTANRTYTFPNLTGNLPVFTITPTNGDCVTWSGTAGLLGDLPGCGGGAGMNTNMNNMANPTAMSQSLTPAAVNTIAAGTALLPFTNIFLGTVANQAGSFNTANLTANRTMNIPDATSTLVRDCPVTTNQFMQAEAIATGTCTKSLINATAASVPSYIADTGAADVYVATLVPAIVAYAPGLTVRFLPANPNATTTPTLNVNGLGAITITKFGQAALQANDLITTAVAQVVYDGTDFELLDPATFSTALTSSSTNTLTNKTTNCESTGNNCSEPIRFFASAAGCSGGSTAGPSLDTGSTNAPTPQCGGTTVTKAYLQFIRGNVAYANGHLPSDWNSSASTDIELGLISTDTTNGHVISFNVQTGCNAASTGASTDDPALNALQAASVTIGAGQVSGGALNFKLTSLTMTGCAADSDFEIALTRNNSGTDTATNALTAVQLKFAEITFGVTKNAANR